MTSAEPGPVETFRKLLQRKLNEKQQGVAATPTAQTLIDLFSEGTGNVVEEE